MQVQVFEAAQEQDAQGFGALSTQHGNLPLVALEVCVSVCGFLSTTTIEQTFRNPHPHALEAVYLFPVTDGGAVQRFSMILPDKEIIGAVKEREAAQREYQAAIASGHQASLAEEERSGLFTLRVGNIPPGTWAKIKLVVVAPLQIKQDEATYRFPLVVAPKYIPGTPLEGASVGDGTSSDTDATPDASRISPPVLLPGFPSPVRLSFSLTLAPAGLTLLSLGSSLHEMELSEVFGGYSLTLRPGERLDRDVLIRFRFNAKDLQSHALLSEAGHFVLTLLPPRQEAAAKPRDVLFLLDRSGSMQGWKLIAARRAICGMLESLRPEDRFAVRAFATQSEGDDTLCFAKNYAKQAAIEQVRQIEADGGTEMLAPLREALSMLSQDTGRDALLVFVTDGQVGNEDQILHYVSKQDAGVRIFAVGVDQAVNATFLERLAKTTRGQCELVESEARVEEVMSRLHRAMMPAVLTGLSLSADGLDAVYPSRLPDVFEEVPVHIWGALKTPGALKVKGIRASGETYEETIEGIKVPNGACIDTMWARAGLRDLEDQFITGQGDPQTLERQMIELSTTYGVVCRFTALLAVDYDKVVNPGGGQQRVIQPVEAPAGWGSQTPKKRSESVLFSLNNLNAPALGARDAKPQQGWVSLPAQPTLRRGGDASQSMTRTGTLTGKLRYLSPEQAKGLPIDERSEIFLLGVLLFEVLTQRHPFDADSSFQTLTNIITKPAPDTLRQDPARSMFAPIVDKCLEKNPNDRLQSLAALLEALRTLQQSGAAAGDETLQAWMQRAFAEEKRAQEAALQSMTSARSFGPYTLGEQHLALTRGFVYLGKRTLADGGTRAVFLEELYPHADPEEQNQFMNEVRFVHPGSVEVLEAIQVGTDALFLAKEYVPGLMLEEALQKSISRQADPCVVLEIFIQALSTLRDAAAQGLHPQELSPEMLWLSFTGEAKLFTWGAARAPQWLAPRVTFASEASSPPPNQDAQAATPTAPAVQAAPAVERRQWWRFWK